MYDVRHIKSTHPRARGSSKYLAAIKATSHPVNIRQIMHVVGLMTGEEPSYMPTHASVAKLVGNGQVIKHDDGTYSAAA